MSYLFSLSWNSVGIFFASSCQIILLQGYRLYYFVAKLTQIKHTLSDVNLLN